MSELEVWAKSKLDWDQLDCKMDIGCNGIELQLFSDIYEDGERISDLWVRSIDMQRLCKYPIKAVHVPLREDDPMHLETICKARMHKNFEQICLFANTIGSRTKRVINITIHSEMSYDMLYESGLLDQLEEHLSLLLKRYQNICICIENVMAVHCKGQAIILRENYLFENVKMVKYLRDKLRCDRIGTCLDTCHMESTLRSLDSIIKYLGCGSSVIRSDSRDFFRANAGYCKQIHLAHCGNYGITKDEHGVVIESKDEITNFLQLYHMFAYECPICLEISEKDYLKCDSYATTYKLLRNLEKI